MVDGHAGWRTRAVRVWLPVGFFLVVALFPFYWMAITSLKPNSELYNPHLMPLLVHQPDAQALCRSADRDEFSDVDLEHDAGRGGLDRDLAGARHMLAYPLARMRFAGAGLIAIDGGGDLSGAAAAAVHAAGRHDQPARARQHADLGDPDLSDHADAVLRLAADRLFQDACRGSSRKPRGSTARAGCRRCCWSSCRCARRASSRPASSPSPCRRTSFSMR